MATITNLKFAIDSSWNGNGVKAARGDLKLLNEDLRRVQNTRIKIDVDLDDTSARRKMDKFKDDAKFMEAKVRLDADTAKAEAEIARVTRDRHMNVYVDDHGFGDQMDDISRRVQQTDDHTKMFGSNASMAMRFAKLGAVAFGASLIVLPGIIQNVGAAITVGMGGAFIAAAALFHKENEGLKNAATDLKDTFLREGREASAGLVEPMIAGMNRLKVELVDLTPQFKAAFDGAGQMIEPLVDGLSRMVGNTMPGLTRAMQNITPVANGLRDGMAQFGSEMSRMFAGMAEGAEGIGMAFEATFRNLGVLMANFGVAAGQMAKDGALLWDGFLDGFNRFLKGYLDGMVSMVTANGPEFAQFWRDFGDAMGGFLREALPGIGQMGATLSTVWGPALREILPPLGSIIGSLASGLRPIIEAMTPILKVFADGLKVFAEWLEKNSWAATILAGALVALKVAAMTNPFVAAIVGATLLVGWLIDLEQKTGMFSNAWRNMVEQFRSGGGVFESIRGGIANVVEWGQRLWSLFSEQLAGAWRSLKEHAGSAFSSLSESFRGLQEALGPLWTQLKPILEFLWNAVKVIAAVIAGDLLLSIKAFGGAILGGLGPAIRMFGEILSEVVQVIKGFIQWVTGILQVFRGTFNAITSIVRIFAGLFTGNMEAVKNAFGDLGRAFATIGNGIVSMFRGVWTVVTAIWDSVVAIFRGAWGIVSGIVKGFVDGVVGFFQWLWDVLVGHSIVPDLFRAIFDWFMWLPNKILGIARAFVDMVVNHFRWLWDTMTQLWANFSQWFGEVWNGFWSWVRDFVGGIWQWIQDRWNNFWATVRAIWDGFKIVFEAAWNAFWSWVRDFVATIWQWIQDRWNTFWTNVRVIWDTFRGWMTDMWNTFWDWVFKKASDVWDMVVQKFTDIKDRVVGIIQDMVNLVKGVWDGIVGIFDGPIEGVKKIWNGVAGIFGLPGFAEGGAVGNAGPGTAASHHATGGAISGAGTGTSDSIPAWLSHGEHVWTAAEVNAVGGQDAMYAMRREVMAGQRRGGSGNAGAYADGGAVEWMWARVKEMAPSMQLTSSYRSTADYHGQGKAIDVSNGTDTTPQMQGLARDIFNGYGSKTLELIHSPSQYNIKDGRGVGDGFSFYGAGTMNQHRNHVHWAVPGPLDGRPGAAAAGGPGMGPSLSAADLKKYEDAKAQINGIIDEAVRTAASISAHDVNMAAQQAQTPGFQGPAISTGLTTGGRKFLASNVMSQKKNANGTWNPAGDTAQMGTIEASLKALEKLEQAKNAMMANGASMGGYGTGWEFYVSEIKEAAKERNLERRAAKIGVATALVESNLRMYANHAVPDSLNFPHDAIGSDHDSIGLFQQRQAGWGTTAERMNPRASAGMFFNALIRLGNWRGMGDGQAAQAVQRSAFPDRYQQRMAEADGLVGAYAQGTHAANSGWAMVGENGPEMVKFRGGDQVYSFDEIISKLKNAATEEGRQVSLAVVKELEKLIQQNKTQAVQQTDTLVDLVERLITEHTGAHIEIPVSGGNTEEVIQMLLSRVIPEIEMALRQRVGRH